MGTVMAQQMLSDKLDPLALSEPLSVAEARKVRLNWTITAKPLYCELSEDEDGAVLLPIPGKVALVRDDTSEVLGLVGEGYQITQPVDFWNIIDRITDATGGAVISAGELDCSKLQYASVQIGESWESMGTKYHKRVSILSGADGKTKLLPIACSCSDDTMIVSTVHEKQLFKPLKHTGDMDSKVDALVKGARQAAERCLIHKKKLLEWETMKVKSLGAVSVFLRKHVFCAEDDFLDKDNASAILTHLDTIEQMIIGRADTVGCKPEILQNVFLATNMFFDHFLHKSQKTSGKQPDDLKLRDRLSGSTYNRKVNNFLAFAKYSQDVTR